jgi:hypothetical protein
MSELATEDSEIGASPLDFGTLRVRVHRRPHQIALTHRMNRLLPFVRSPRSSQPLAPT